VPRQYLAPGWGLVDETGNRQYLIPGSGFVNETQSTGSVGSASGSSTAVAYSGSVGTAAGSSSANAVGTSTGTISEPGRAYLLPGGGILNPVGTRQFLLPGWSHINLITASQGSVGAAAGSSTATAFSPPAGIAAGTSTAAAVSGTFSAPLLSYLVSGWGVLNPKSARQYLLPGWGYFNISGTPGSIGSAAGSSTASAVSAILRSSTGLASGTSSAIASPLLSSGAAGIASGSSTASAVGQAQVASCAIYFCPDDLFNYINLDVPQPATAVGAASGSSTAAATGRSDVAGVGEAAGTSTADAVGDIAAAGPAYAPIVLPAGVAAAYSVIRPVNWTGDGFRAHRVADGAKQFFGYNSDNALDLVAADEWAPGGWYLDTWVDVSGNGHDFPVDGTRFPRNYGNTINGIRSFTFNGPSVGSRLANSTLSFPDIRTHTMVRIFRPYHIYNADWGNIGHPTYVGAFSGVRTTSGLNFAGVAANTRGAVTNPQLLIANYKGASAGTLKQNGITQNITPIASATATGFRLGGSSTFMGSDDLLFAYYTRSLSPAEEAQLETQARTFGVTPASETVGTLALIGDSITMGFLQAGTGAETTYAYKIQNLMSTRLTHFNLALAGETAGGGAARATTLATMGFVSGMPAYGLIAYGTNDIAFSSTKTAAATYADIKTIVDACYARGYAKVAVKAILPRTSGFQGGQNASGFEAKRLELNALIESREGIDFDKFLNDGGDPVIGNPANVATYFYDFIHPNNAGGDLIAPIVSTGLDTMINS
jgi:hypothetical protein